MRWSFHYVLTVLTFATFIQSNQVLAIENVLGASAISTNSSGNNCSNYWPNSGCKESSESIRIYYGARINPNIELRGSYSILNIKLTDTTDYIYNSPNVSSDVTDVSILFLWALNDSWHVNLKTGLGYWVEILPGGGFLSSSGSNTGISPVFGGELEWGNQSLRATLNVDIYPSMDKAGTVSILGVGLRYVW